jgi:hypothetical protein
MMAFVSEEERYGLVGLAIGLQNKDLPLVTENLLKVKKTQYSCEMYYTLKVILCSNIVIAWIPIRHHPIGSSCTSPTRSFHQFYRGHRERF